MLVFLAGLILLLLVLLFLLLPGRVSPAAQRAARALYGYNCAHRGLHSEDKAVPENSLAAFRAAVDAGYGMELDIQLTRDAEVVVFHDDDLKRVCGLDGRVDSFTLEELRTARLEGTDHGIPLFSEVLALVAGQTPLIVELKMGPRNRLLCEKAVELLAEYEGPYCVESFDPRIVGWFKRRAPEILRGQLSAPARHLSSGFFGVLVGGLFTNFLARPHFVAYRIGKIPPTARLARRMAIPLAWTALPTDDIPAVEAANDAVIFEHYRPSPRYKQPPPV